jgi:hypothetical protein
LNRSSHCRDTSFGENFFGDDGFLSACVADRQKYVAIIKNKKCWQLFVRNALKEIVHS